MKIHITQFEKALVVTITTLCELINKNIFLLVKIHSKKYWGGQIVFSYWRKKTTYTHKQIFRQIKMRLNPWTYETPPPHTWSHSCTYPNNHTWCSDLQETLRWFISERRLRSNMTPTPAIYAYIGAMQQNTYASLLFRRFFFDAFRMNYLCVFVSKKRKFKRKKLKIVKDLICMHFTISKPITISIDIKIQEANIL